MKHPMSVSLPSSDLSGNRFPNLNGELMYSMAVAVMEAHGTVSNLCACCGSSVSGATGCIHTKESKCLENIAAEFFTKNIVLFEGPRCKTVAQTVRLCHQCVIDFIDHESFILRKQLAFLSQLKAATTIEDVLADPWLDFKRASFANLKRVEVTILEKLRIIDNVTELSKMAPESVIILQSGNGQEETESEMLISGSNGNDSTVIDVEIIDQQTSSSIPVAEIEILNSKENGSVLDRPSESTPRKGRLAEDGCISLTPIVKLRDISRERPTPPVPLFNSVTASQEPMHLPPQAPEAEDIELFSQDTTKETTTGNDKVSVVENVAVEKNCEDVNINTTEPANPAHDPGTSTSAMSTAQMETEVTKTKGSSRKKSVSGPASKLKKNKFSHSLPNADESAGESDASVTRVSRHGTTLPTRTLLRTPVKRSVASNPIMSKAEKKKGEKEESDSSSTDDDEGKLVIDTDESSASVSAGKRKCASPAKVASNKKVKPTNSATVSHQPQPAKAVAVKFKPQQIEKNEHDGSSSPKIVTLNKIKTTATGVSVPPPSPRDNASSKAKGGRGGSEVNTSKVDRLLKNPARKSGMVRIGNRTLLESDSSSSGSDD